MFGALTEYKTNCQFSWVTLETFSCLADGDGHLYLFEEMIKVLLS